jgi:capsule biosynthesis phosphatase
MRLSIDLDGVICEINRSKNYDELLPIPGAIEAIKKLRAEGHYVIIHTARHMKTMESNLGKVVAAKGFITLEWLTKTGIEYDEIYFGKPWADIYIDDNAFKFESWDQTSIFIQEKTN